MPDTVIDLDPLALKLRRCYQYERNFLAQNLGRDVGYRVPRCWDVSARAGARARKDSIWHKLARFCQGRGIDPVHYVQWCLHVNQVLLGPPPEPNELLRPARMDAYRDNLPKQRRIIELNLLIQKREAERHFAYLKAVGCRPKRCWAITLVTASLAISPLMRYCLALRLACRFSGKIFRRLADDFEPEALLQYQRDPEAYGDLWRGLGIPSDFAERAERFYDQVLEEEP